MASSDVINTHNTPPKVTKKSPDHPHKFLIIIFFYGLDKQILHLIRTRSYSSWF